MATEAPLLAIDFGTCYSSAARIVDGRPEPVKEPIRHGYSVPSSVLMTRNGELLVGFQAEDRKAALPTNYQAEFKRWLGDDTRLPLGDRELLPEELVVEMLRFLKRQADGNELDHRRAILTVPAAHADHKRTLMADAARAAGFDEVELLDEPVAAALQHGRRDKGDETVLVYDLGGGTFDAALIRFAGHEHRVLDKDGCDVGGANFDRTIERDLAAQSPDELAAALRGLRSEDPDERIRAERAKLVARDFCESAKKHLSQSDEFDEALLIGDAVIDYRLTRDRLRTLIAADLDATIACCRRLLERSGVAADDVDAVLMVGGSCRLPFIGDGVREAFGRPVRDVADPELAVCLGAARWHQARIDRTREAEAAVERKREQRRRRDDERRADKEREQARTRAARNQASVTKLVQEGLWTEISDDARTWLLDAVLHAPEDEEIGDLVTDVDAGDGQDSETVLLMTSRRLLWTGPDGKATGTVTFGEAVAVEPATTEEDGLIGLQIRTGEALHRFDLQLTGLDDDEILGWIERIAEGLPVSATELETAIRGNLRMLFEHAGYKAATAMQRAWLADGLATAETPEEIWGIERTADLALVTTTKRLIWAKTETTGRLAFADITRISPGASAERGLYGLTVEAGAQRHRLQVPEAELNFGFLCVQCNMEPLPWAANLRQIRTFPQWPEIASDARRWLENAIIAVPNDELRWLTRCSYGTDWTTTTSVVLLSAHVAWVRSGAFTGLSSRLVPYKAITKLTVDSIGVVLEITGTQQHRFGITHDGVIAELRARCPG